MCLEQQLCGSCRRAVGPGRAAVQDVVAVTVVDVSVVATAEHDRERALAHLPVDTSLDLAVGTVADGAELQWPPLPVMQVVGTHDVARRPLTVVLLQRAQHLHLACRALLAHRLDTAE